MKINDATGPSALNGSNGTSGPAALPSHAPAARATDAAGTTAAERVSLSAQSRELAGMAAQAAPVDAAKVNAIRAALADGSFRASPERIADGLIASTRELFGKGK